MAANAQRWARGVVVLLIVASAVSLFPQPAHACSCIESTLDQRVGDLDYVFVGRQIERVVLDEIADNGVRLVFEVERVYKGEVTTPFEVYTHAQSSACGASFGDNVRVRVVASRWQGKPSVGLCDQLIDTSDAGLKAAFGAGKVPLEVPLVEPLPPEVDTWGRSETGQEPTPWAWIVGAAVVGFALLIGAVGAFIRQKAE